MTLKRMRMVKVVNLERKRKIECQNANCGFTKERCLVHYGKECIRNGGSRIPVQSATPSESFPLSIPAQTTFKPYFIVGEAMDEDWRD